MREDDDHPGGRPKHPRDRRRDGGQRVHVLEAQHEHRRVEGGPGKRRHRLEAAGVADGEPPVAAVSPTGERDQPRAGIDPGVARTARSDVRREDTLSGAHVDDLLARPRVEQREGGRDGDPLVVRAAVRADPAVVPPGDIVPATAGLPRRASRTAFVRGHGGRIQSWRGASSQGAAQRCGRGIVARAPRRRAVRAGTSNEEAEAPAKPAKVVVSGATHTDAPGGRNSSAGR